ncbi:hypothetical protein K438DRAFT_1783660 [Mycena galopus ATCC 62051]|nr:hypothetical protein K438DRAFT_1783660 [Mycena galopus ATCC 62051]
MAWGHSPGLWTQVMSEVAHHHLGHVRCSHAFRKIWDLPKHKPERRVGVQQLGLRSVSVCDGSTARRDGFRSVRRAALPAQKTDGYGTGSPVYTGPVSVRKRVDG